MFEYRPRFDRRHRRRHRIVWLLLLGLTAGVGVAHWQPELTSPWALADAAWAMGQPESALPLYRRAIAEYPYDADRPLAEYRVARCLQMMGQREAANDAYRHFLRAHPEHALADAVRTTLTVYPIAAVD